MNSQNDRTILISGSSRGLGHAIAMHYASTGCKVYGFSRGKCDISQEHYTHITCDITSETNVRAALARINKEAGGFDILINNAGVKFDNLVMFSSIDQAEETMRTNFIGTYLLSREAMKSMKRRRFGRIINISSMAVPLGSLGCGIYSASKAAVDQFSYSLSRELGQDDITINTIGITTYEDSEMVKSIDPNTLKETQNQLTKPAPLSIDEILHVVNFLISPFASGITNQTIYFGGIR